MRDGSERLYLVAPDSREEDVRKQLARPAFRRAPQIPEPSLDLRVRSVAVAPRLEHFRCRVSSYRDHCAVPPGLYAVGEPDANSDVCS